jgi:transposase-like protein
MNVIRRVGEADTLAGTPRSDGERSEPERSGGPANVAPAAPPVEVTAAATRRRFTVAYKLAIVQEADRLEWGQIGALLRREGLYHSHLEKWRKRRAAGWLDPAHPRRPGPKPAAPTPWKKEKEQLLRDNARLQKKLKKAELVIDFQKKVAALLEIPLNEPDDDGSA